MLVNVEETEEVRLPNGSIVPVSSLDEKYRMHMKVIDKLRDDIAQKNYELQVYRVALAAKRDAFNKILGEYHRD